LAGEYIGDAVRGLVENALQHGGETPTVTVSVT
jgi:hypothetical protein